MKLFFWVMGGLFSLCCGGFLTLSALGAWALDLHESKPHSGSVSRNEAERMQDDLQEIRQDVKQILRRDY